MAETSRDVLNRYLQDAIATGIALETHLQKLAQESRTMDRQVFTDLASESKRHHERLNARLQSLGGSTSGTRTLLAHLFTPGPNLRAARSHTPFDKRMPQELVTLFAAENSSIALLETLAIIAEAASDPDTADIARELQEQERAAARIVLHMLAASAPQSSQSSSAQ